jgi:leucyl aminopeptidase
MVDIKEQVEFELEKEEKSIVLANNKNHYLVNEIEKVLGKELNKVSDKPFTVVYTLGKMKAEKLYVVNYEKLDCKESLSKIYDQIASIDEDCVVLVDTFENDNYQKIMQDLSEKILTKNYTFNKFKSSKEEKNKDFFYYGETKIYNSVKKGFVYGESINIARDLVNTPYNYLKAEDLAEFAKGLEKFDTVTTTIYDKPVIEEMNMGAFLGVNAGSLDEPKLIYVKYQGLDKWENPTALVGKGVMYDTGGYSLKTPTSMPGMKVDMAGSAAVLSAINALARLDVKANVMAIVAATDNRIGDGAIVPDDILTSANGKTIEIISTDAEGRLTLADAVWFAQKEGAKRVIDVATLTGAMVMALGKEFTGAFTNNEVFLNEFKEATKLTNEPIWEMPITKGYHDELKSKVADLKNKGGRTAGASQAAAFIEEFIDKDTEWIHLDVAGTASNNDGATGVMVKSFTELFIKN